MMAQRYLGKAWPEYVAFIYRFPYESGVRIKAFGHRKNGRPSSQEPDDWKFVGAPKIKFSSAIRGYFTKPREDLVSEQLLEWLEHVQTSIPGFYSGRVDIKAGSEESLQAGKELYVIDVNLNAIGDIGEKSTRYHNPFLFLLQIRTIILQAYIGTINIFMGQYSLEWLLTRTIPFGMKRAVLCQNTPLLESRAPMMEFMFGRH